jgi:hypothetical protein
VTPNNVYGHGRLDLVELFTGDLDTDGAANIDDCALQDNSAWSLADDITDLMLNGKPATTLAWSQPAQVGATSFAYDVLRSDSAADFSSAVCIASGQAGTTAADSTPPGQVFHYLAQTVNPCGPSPGSGSAGSRNTFACP